MTFSERMKEMLEQTWTASKDLAIKAGEKAQELGERGMIMLDIKMLENQAQKLISRLGNEVYVLFSEKEREAVTPETEEIKTFLEQIASVKEKIEKKETELKNRKS